MTVSAVHHVGVVVRSLDGALPCFRDLFGLPFVAEETVEEQGVRAALLDLGNCLLELLEPTVPDTGIARYLERRGEGLHHVCLETDDLRGCLADLAARQVPLVDTEPRTGLVGEIAFLHPSALHGTLVELVAREPAYRGTSGGALVQRLDHLVLAVADAQAAARTWGETLGLRADAPVRPTAGGLELVPLPLEGAFLELAQATDTGHPVAHFVQERGEGMFAVSLQVAAVDEARRTLGERGLALPEPEPGPFPETRVTRVPRERVHGVAVQLIERGGA